MEQNQQQPAKSSGAGRAIIIVGRILLICAVFFAGRYSTEYRPTNTQAALQHTHAEQKKRIATQARDIKKYKDRYAGLKLLYADITKSNRELKSRIEMINDSKDRDAEHYCGTRMTVFLGNILYYSSILGEDSDKFYNQFIQVLEEISRVNDLACDETCRKNREM